MTASQLLSILKARWISVLALLLLTVGVTITVSLLLPKNYTATASVLLDVRSADPVGGQMMATLNSPSYMATQVDVLTSDRVALQVVKKLKLNELPELRRRWIEENGSKGNYDSWVAGVFRKRLDVKPARESTIIAINYTNAEPRAASMLANAFAQAYIDVSIGLRSAPAKQYSEFFDTKAKESREALERAQEKLSNFQKINGLLNADERFDIETQRLNELNSQLVALQAVAAESVSRNSQAQTSADKTQEVINNGLVSGLRADLNRQEVRLMEMTARLGDEHPQVKELRANISELTKRIEVETRRVTGGIGVTSTINRQREIEVRTSLESQRSKVMRLKALRDEALLYSQEVAAAQRTYDQMTQRLNQSNLESQVTQTNISVLSPAVEPAEPSSPKIILNTFVSLFAGAMLGVTFALVREFMDRRVRTLADLSNGLDIPVLGTLPGPVRPSLSNRGSPLLLPANILKKLPRAST